MATNEIFRDADHITLPVVADVISGEAVVVGSLIGVAQTDRDADGNAAVWRKGAYEFTVGDATYAVGDPIYGHAAGGGAVTGRVELIDGTDTTGTLLGYSLEAKTTTGGTGTLIVALTQV